MIELVTDPRVVAELVRGLHAQPVRVPMHGDLKPHVFQLALRHMQNLVDDESNRDRWKWGTENDDGLVRKFPTPENPTTDSKWFYHQKMLTWQTLAKEKGLDIKHHQCFFRTNEFITEQAIKMVKPYVEALDEQLPGYAFLKNFRTAEHLIRLIIDDPPSVTNNLEVASEHTDFAFCTFHLYENRPEFQWYDETTNTWESVLHDPNAESATFFLGRKAALMTGGKRKVSPEGIQTKEVVPHSGILKPLLHRVREIGKPKELTTPRLAVVVFFHVPLVL